MMKAGRFIIVLDHEASPSYIQSSLPSRIALLCPLPHDWSSHAVGWTSAPHLPLRAGTLHARLFRALVATIEHWALSIL